VLVKKIDLKRVGCNFALEMCCMPFNNFVLDKKNIHDKCFNHKKVNQTWVEAFSLYV
jgi:hypothetical protein